MFVNQKKLEESMIETDNMTNYQVVMDAIKADRENVLSKEKFYSISCGPKYTIVINSNLNAFLNIYRIKLRDIFGDLVLESERNSQKVKENYN